MMGGLAIDRGADESREPPSSDCCCSIWPPTRRIPYCGFTVEWVPGSCHPGAQRRRHNDAVRDHRPAAERPGLLDRQGARLDRGETVG